MITQASSTLVTGANGFVGRAVVEALASEATRDVVAAVRQSAGAEVFGSGNVRVISGLTLDSSGFNKGAWCNALEGIEVVVHCAARVHVMSDTEADPLQAFREVNVDGSLAVARAASQAGVSRFVFVSSVKVLGESTEGRGAFVGDDALAPKDAYGQSKAEAEVALADFCGRAGIELVIVRPPLVYGPGVGGNFQSLLKLADTRFPLPFGGLDNRRSMIYVGNLSDIIRCCVDQPGLGGKTFLVSDGDDLSTTALFTLARRGLGRGPRLFAVPSALFRFVGNLTGKSGVVDRLFGSLQVDISEAGKVLSWQPPFAPEAGIRETARAYSESKNSE